MPPTSRAVNVEEQLADGDAVLRCFRPLLGSMRVLGLYFTPPTASRRIPHGSTTADRTDLELAKNWNGGRVYAVIMLAKAKAKTIMAMAQYKYVYYYYYYY